MSLITDALRAAQREKMQRQGAAVPASAVLGFIPVRATRQGGRSLVLGALSSAAVLSLATSVWFLIRATRGVPAQPQSRLAVVTSASRPTSGTPAPAANRGVGAANARVLHTDSARRAPAPTSTLESAQRARSRDSLLAAVRTLGPPPASPLLLQRYAIVPEAQAPANDETRPSASSLNISVEPAGNRDAMRLFEQGVIAHNRGDLATARGLYEQSIMLDPNVSNVHNNLGAVFSAMADLPHAFDEFRRAVSLEPTNAAAWTNLGAGFRAIGRADDAVAAFQRAIKLDPKNAVAQVGLAQQYVAIGAVADAKRLLERVLADNPAAVEAHYSLGQLLEQSGDRAGAIREYRAFLALAEPRYAAYADQVRRHLEVLSDASR